MRRYVTMRLLQGIIVIILVSIGTFGMLHLVPGDPIHLLVGEARITQAELDAIRARWGLDQPVYKQYLVWVTNMLRGEMGQSMLRPGVSVRSMILEAAVVTVKLNLLALAVAVCVAIPAGIFAAVKKNHLLDYLVVVTASLGVALPNFWVGLMLIVLFALKLQVLPPFGIMDWKGYVLPVAVLAFDQSALLTRMMRGATLEVLGQDFVRTARAKGVAENGVLMKHVARNALLPVITMLGYRLAFVLSGTIVVETVFALPGLGRLFIGSVTNLDYQVVQAIVFVLSVVVVLGNLLTDLVYSVIDPRIRLA